MGQEGFLTCGRPPDAGKFPGEDRPSSVRGGAVRSCFPFSAIVGQDTLKLAMVIAAVDPSIGGVLAFGDRGTGKSTTVRALAALLPPMRSVANCAYHCHPDDEERCQTCGSLGSRKLATVLEPVPVVDLPLGATEDRVVGALNLERALSTGEKAFEPGLLARANRGFLYIDEVNLLEDHLVDLLLDVAASGVNVVEREGLSVRHPARFVLIGSGNPEEGELRPQLLDRFGLSVEVRTPADLKTRVEIVKRRDAYESDREAFCKAWATKDRELRTRIRAARRALKAIETPDALYETAARICISLGSDGLRGEITLMRGARALACLKGRSEVAMDDLREVAPMALSHRLRRDPLDEAGSTARVERALSQMFAV
jgi:magnesium chelatase subunit I